MRDTNENDSGNTNNETRSRRRRIGYAEWIALGAIAAGSVGAVVGLRKSRNSMRAATAEPSDPETVTAPHGDKLKGAVV